MIIQHNLNAINANNKLSGNVVGVKKAQEKLSSGFRINRAGDDAAGLAISEKMRAQIRGLGQNMRNINDGIGMLNVADAAMEELHAITQRMNELALQSTNGTLSDEERRYVDMEFQELKKEIDRIVVSTEFNEIKVFEGREKYLAIGVPGMTYGTTNINQGGAGHIVDAGINDELTFKYNGVKHSITLPAGTYSKDDLVDLLNGLFEAQVGAGKITVSTGNPELGENPDALVYDAHGGDFDAFGGNMMWDGVELTSVDDLATSIISNIFSRGGTTVGALTGGADIEAGVTINEGDNTLSFRLNGEGGGEASIYFKTGFHTAEDIVKTINSYFKTHNMTATASINSSGRLVISRTLGGTSNTISLPAQSGAYDVLMRNVSYSYGTAYTQINGSDTLLYPPTPADLSNPPPGVVERDGKTYIPPSGGSPTIPNPNYGQVTSSQDVAAQWSAWTALTRPQTTGNYTIGQTFPVAGARTNPTITNVESRVIPNSARIASVRFSQTLTGARTVVAGLNDTFSFTYGGTTYNAQVAAGSYASPAALVTAINAALGATSSGVTCEYNSNQLVFNGKTGDYTSAFSGVSGSLLNSVLTNVNGTTTSQVATYKREGSSESGTSYNLTAQPSFSGSALPSETYIYSGVNDVLNFEVDGTAISVTLQQGKYSPTDLATEIRNKLAEKNVDNVTISNTGNRLTFTNTSVAVGDECLPANLPTIRLTGGSASDTLFRTSMNTGSSTTAPLVEQYEWRYEVGPYIRDYTDTAATIPNPDYSPGNASDLHWVYETPQYRYNPAAAQRGTPASGYSFQNPMTINASNNVLSISVTDPDGNSYNYDVQIANGTYTADQMYDELNRKISAIPDCAVRMAPTSTAAKSSLRVETANGGADWVVELSGAAFNTLYGTQRATYGGAPSVTAPRESNDAVSEGRVNLSKNPITNIIKGVNDVLTFDLNIDGVITPYTAVIDEGSYDAEELVAAMNRAISESGASGVRAELSSVKTGLGEYLSTRLAYTPRSTGTAVIEGIGGSAAYSVFYRGLLEDQYIPPHKLVLQVGPDSEPDRNQYITDIPVELSLKRLKLDSASCDTQERAMKAIETVYNAINMISEKRAISGADVNALEHTYGNVVNRHENITAAESQIRDADMASMMLNYVKYQILTQSAQAVLAQASKEPQAILQLLS